MIKVKHIPRFTKIAVDYHDIFPSLSSRIEMTKEEDKGEKRESNDDGDGDDK